MEETLYRLTSYKSMPLKNHMIHSDDIRHGHLINYGASGLLLKSNENKYRKRGKPRSYDTENNKKKKQTHEEDLEERQKLTSPEPIIVNHTLDENNPENIDAPEALEVKPEKKKLFSLFSKKEKPEKKDKKLKKERIKKENKKPFFTIWDYSELEYDALEKETSEKINQDGFYDEILPMDANEEMAHSGSRAKINRTLILLVISAIGLLSAIVFMIMKMFNLL